MNLQVTMPFKAEFYKYFSNELAPILLDVNGSWGKLGTMGVTLRTAIISAKSCHIWRQIDSLD